jgi:hypothetical protein
MFCTACAATNPLSSHRCFACGARLAPAAGEGATGGIKPRSGRRGGWGRRLGPLRLTLAVVLPVTMLLAGGGYWQSEREARAAAYSRGEAALAAGRYVEASDAFAAAGDYRDAEQRRAMAEAALAPFRVAYLDGVAALAAGDYATAIGLLIPVVRDLPGYRDASALLAEARLRREQELYRTVEIAEQQRDWLVVERALAELVAANPEDAVAQTRLADVRHDHAPLVFSRGQALYLVGPDGTDERPVFDGFPAVWPVWSPDRSRIAFVSPDRSDYGDAAALYVVGADGSGARRLADGLRPSGAPVWSPDGTWIAFTSQEPVEGIDDPNPRTIRIVEVGTGREVDLTGGRLPNAASPSWSPDGRRLAVVSRSDEGLPGADLLPSGEVYVVTVATGELTDVGRGRIGDPWRLAWSPAAEAIVVSTRQPGMSFDADRTPLYLLDVESGELTNLNPRLAKVSMPVWSPDGQRLAYVESETTVRVRGLDGGERWTTLDAAVAGALTWSPGGDALLAAGVPGQPSFLIPLGAEFGREREVTLTLDVDARQAGSPQWSPINPAPPPATPTTAGTARDSELAAPATGESVALPAGAR